MAANLLSKIKKLIESGDEEIKCSAIRVLGALGVKDAAFVKFLGSKLVSDSEMVKLAVLDAFIRNPQPKALNYLLPLLKQEGALRRKAIHAIAAIGTKAIDLLDKEFRAAAPQEKKLFIDILSGIHSKATVDFLIRNLQQADIEMLKYICFALRNQIQKMTPEERNYLLQQVNKFLGLPEVKKKDELTTSGIILMGYLGSPAAKKMLLQFMDGKRSHYVMRNALHSLTRLNLSGTGHADVIETVYPLLNDGDFANVVRNALTILEAVKLPASYSAKLSKLLQTTPHSSVKRFALKVLGQAGTRQSAKLLIDYLETNDSMVRDTAVEVLSKLPAAVPDLLKVVESTKSNEKAERVAVILRSHRDYFKKEKCRPIYLKLDQAVKAANPEKEKIYSLILKQGNPDFFYAETMKRILTAKRAKKWQTAKQYLDLLAGGAFYTEEARYQMASVMLALSKKDPNPAARQGDPALQLYANLARASLSSLTSALKKDTSLDANSLHYLGFYFADRQYEQKTFGVEALKLLVKRSPKSKLASSAKQKIKLAGKVPTQDQVAQAASQIAGQ